MRLRFHDIYFDVSNLFHIAYSNTCRDLNIGEPTDSKPNLTPENRCSVALTKRLNTHATYEVFKRIGIINNEFRSPKGISYFLLDAKDEELNKRQSTRKMLAEHYKGGRTHKSDNFYSLLKNIAFILSNLDDSFRVVTRPSFEADDLVHPLLEKNKVSGSYTPTLLVSNDVDWARAVDDNTIHILMDRKVYDLARISTRLGLKPDHNRVIMYKMVFGDESDGIKKPENLKGHKKDLLELINNLGSYRDLLSIDRSILKYTNVHLGPKLLLKHTQDELQDNFTLINYLDFDGDIDDYTTFGALNKPVLSRYLKGLALEPNKIQPQLMVKLGWTKPGQRKYGAKV